MRSKAIARVRGVVQRPDGTILLFRLKGLDFWSLPGGGMDEGEDILSCLQREMIEETAIEPEVGDLLYVQQYAEDGKFYEPEFFFAITNYQDYENIDLAKTTHGLEEVEELAFLDPKTTRVLPLFLKELDSHKGHTELKIIP